jgi:branched-chain amino acid transport system substrate-binding protein
LDFAQIVQQGERLMRGTRRRVVSVVTVVAVAGLVSLGLVTSGAGAQSSPTPGVTAKSVKIGFIFSETGVAGSTFKNTGKAFQARIDRQNAQGGVNGRKIDVEIVDDASTGANLTGAQDLVQNRKVFMVIDNSSFAFLAYRYLRDAGVPMIGGGYDGTYYGQKGNEDIISVLGNGAPVTGLTTDVVAKVMKQKGATKVAGLAYGASASSVASTKAVMNYAVPGQGMKSVYTNTTLDFGTSDVGPIVLGIKNSGANALYPTVVAATDIALIQGLQQSGVNLKAAVLPTGYGQELLDSPAAESFGPNVLFSQTYKPVELKDKDTKRFQADLKKYAGLTGVPDYGQYLGYISGELLVLGLEHAGKDLTRQGFVDGLHKLGSYDAAGLNCQPYDISLENFGKAPAAGCSYLVYVKDGKFALYNKGKPVTGKLVGDPALVAANKSGTLEETATTAAAPAG